MMGKVVIDEKLFAQINNDAFLLGTKDLQGNQFGNNIGYLRQFIEGLDVQSDNVSHLIPRSAANF